MTTDLFNDAEDHLKDLDNQFMAGVEMLSKNDIDGGAECMRRILRVEPRLAEPRVELARVLLETAQLSEAEAEIREAIRILENGGQWIDHLPENEVQSVAYGLLAEVLRKRGESDEVVFGDATEWRAIVDESHAAFRKARDLDPKNAHADYWAGGFDVDDEDRESPATD
jgi:tetratricopeptide (TPR) repeat protein